VIDSTRSRPQLLRDHERVFLTIESLMYAGRVHCPVLIPHGGSDITVPIRSAERIANAIRSGGNSGVTSGSFSASASRCCRTLSVRIAVGFICLLSQLRHNCGTWMTNWAATHSLIAAGKTCGAEC
jgi:hypothetical protein